MEECDNTIFLSLFGNLTLTQVYAALTYYHANGDEIEADIAAKETEIEENYCIIVRHKGSLILKF